MRVGNNLFNASLFVISIGFTKLALYMNEGWHMQVINEAMNKHTLLNGVLEYLNDRRVIERK
ncbi:hypothetical protein ALQ54_02510 [Pseudomonas syringae]|nr:hypothetical protein ALQ54_02510 [Pseudomonas syringae]